MKVGEYARLNNTLYNTVVILKIMEVYDNTILTENNGSIFQGEYGKDEIIKHSYNIIDLIEVGDIVNYGLIGGGMVLHKENDKITTNTLLFGILKNKDIKTVITKEQIKNMEYKVGEIDER